ncbi:MAG: hypothetical protein PHS62_02195 [Patescibacteria group bacterium]|nr:hypothetical protein [Patescibacteria group bacterium]
MSSKLFINRVAAQQNPDSVFVLPDFSGAHIRLLGASCKTDIAPSGNWVDSVTFFPATGRSAIVALMVRNAEKSPGDWNRSFFLKITWREGKPWINLDEAWVSPADRPGHASEWGVTVQINDVTYSSVFSDEKRQSPTRRFVRDGNLLCRYLIGDATTDEVQAAAQAFQEEQAWPAKYAALEQQCAEAAEEEAKAWVARHTALEEKVASLRNQLASEEIRSATMLDKWAELKEALATSEVVHQEQSAKIADLHNKLAAEEIAAAAAQQECAKLEKQFAAQQSALKAHQEEVARLENVRDDQLRTIQDLQLQHTAATMEIEDLKKQLAAKEGAFNFSRSRAVDLAGEVDRLTKALKTTNEQKAVAQRSIRTIKEAVKHAGLGQRQATLNAISKECDELLEFLKAS